MNTQHREAAAGVVVAYRTEVAARQSAGSVSYSTVNSSTYTVSGVGADGLVYYERVAWGPGSVDTLEWTYDPALWGEMDPVVSRSAASLSAGDVTLPH